MIVDIYGTLLKLPIWAGLFFEEINTEVEELLICSPQGAHVVLLYANLVLIPNLLVAHHLREFKILNFITQREIGVLVNSYKIEDNDT